MSLKKLVAFTAMAGYLYTLAFGIFMTDIFRIPAPIVFGLLLLFFVKSPLQPYAYYRESNLFIIALFLYYIVGLDDYKSFFAYLITIITCALYFNYFVGLNKQRFNASVIVMYSLLLLSMLVMVLDHSFPGIIDPLRSTLLDEQVKQSPAGLAVTQFTFGYQVAVFTAFAFISTIVFRLPLLVKILAFVFCILCLYLGMNRSAFLCFATAAVLFMLIYYRFKAVIVIAASVSICFLVYNYVLKDNLDTKNNILAKNQAKEAYEYDRGNMALENLKIYVDYPYGLIFYGKSWEEVSYRNPLFTFGLSSHNAYLMFFTFLGPFLGLGLLLAIYYRIARLFGEIMSHVRLKDNALLLVLLFSFAAVSLNALFHNGWLLGGDGPTLFLYFGILQGSRIYRSKHISEPTPPIAEMAVIG